VKKTLKDIIILMFVVFVGYNIYLNREIRKVVDGISRDITYMFAVSVIPDRATFIYFNYGNMTSPLLTVDISLPSFLTGDYGRALDGVSMFGLKFALGGKKKKDKEEKKRETDFVIPFCKYIKINGGKIIFRDKENKVNFRVSGIKGKSVYHKAEDKMDEYFILTCTGKAGGKISEQITVKFYFYPYNRNTFYCNIFGTKINARTFEPMFRKQNLKIDSGIINFIVQIQAENRMVYLNNMMEFRNLKIKEDIGLDFKALFGVSYEQIGNFLTDSKGDLYVNFDMLIKDDELPMLGRYYSEKFSNSVGDRIKVGVVTAPVRQVTDLIWNLTGENIFRIFRLFGGD